MRKLPSRTQAITEASSRNRKRSPDLPRRARAPCGRSTDSESFAVEYGVAGGSWVSIQQPSAMSASMARVRLGRRPPRPATSRRPASRHSPCRRRPACRPRRSACLAVVLGAAPRVSQVRRSRPDSANTLDSGYPPDLLSPPRGLRTHEVSSTFWCDIARAVSREGHGLSRHSVIEKHVPTCVTLERAPYGVPRRPHRARRAPARRRPRLHRGPHDRHQQAELGQDWARGQGRPGRRGGPQR